MKKGFPSAGRLSEGPQDGYFNARLIWTTLGALLLLTLASGCAMQPPTTQTSFTGPRLVVTMTVQNNPLTGNGIYPAYYYFFVINYAVNLPGQTATSAGNPGAPGPVAIFQPTGGPNGFVASSDGSTFGYSDYVEYNGALPYGFGLFHFIHPNPSNPQEVELVSNGQPAQYTLLNNSTLQFTIYLTQLVHASNPGLTPTQELQQAQGIKYLQVNFITTNTINPSAPAKATDALGPIPDSNYLTLILGQLPANGQVINNQNAPPSVQLSGNVYTYGNTSPDPSLELTGWSIQYFAD